MIALLDVILPVFLLIASGWSAARIGWFSDSAVSGLMRFAQTFAVPCLLFRSIATLDLGQAFDLGLMVSFYTGSFSCFALAMLLSLTLFKRPLTDAVAIGFAAFFSNALLLGLPITERAFGPQALTGNFTIISIHSPTLYAIGIVLMEWARSRGKGLSRPALAKQVLRAIFSQPMVLGISAGLLVNFAGLTPPDFVMSAVNMMAQAAIPAALFGLGGVLLRYKIEGDRSVIAMVCTLSLIVHPTITYGLGHWVFDLSDASLRSAVMTACMAPGVNAYLFSHQYGVAMRVGAASVLIATALSLITISFWLAILP